MTLYAETSAVLRWLLGQPSGDAVRDELARAERVATSALTGVECERALARLAGAVADEARAAARTLLHEAVRHWTLVEIDTAIRARAGQPFPVEPLRTLDALHLATALELESAIGPVQVLSTDDRLTSNARALGLAVLLG
jgi:predicted nucleic acid-binding protein